MKRFFEKELKFINNKGFIIISLVIFLVGVNTSLYAPYLSLFLTHAVKVSPIALGFFLGLSSLSAIVSSMVIARISDVVNSRKSIIMLVLFAGIIGYLIFAFSRNYYILLITSIFFIGISTASFPQIFAYARETIISGDDRHQVLANSLLRSFFSIAWVVGPLIGIIIMGQYNFTRLYSVITIIFAFIFLLVFIFSKNKNIQKSNKAIPIKINKYIVLNIISFVLIFTATSMSLYSLPLYLTETLNGTSKQIGHLFSISASVEIPLMILGGYFVRSIGKCTLIQIGFLSFFAYCLLLSLVTMPFYLYPIQLLSGVAVSQIMGTGISHFQDLIRDQPGTTTTLFTNSSKLGGVLGGICFGIIIYFFDYRTVYIICSVISVIAFYIFYIANSVNKKSGMRVAKNA
jgi:SET family sugar efflux transporter-like MFS transporter